VARGDFYDSLFGSIYSAYMERPRINRVVAGLLWGGSTRTYYESMAAIGRIPRGGTVVDCPCGAGPAFRALEPGAGVRYVAADLSPAMLRRARTRAEKRGLSEVEFVEAKAEDLPLDTDSADLFLCYWGIHVFPDPQAAVAEIARVLKPGGRLVGACFVRGPSLRQRLTLRPNTTDFGPMCTEPELLEWLAQAGMLQVDSSRSGLFMFFEATFGGAGSVELGDQHPQS
jgi:ubiquinone/menaquinone biosynthesis C-methylase UbiE